MEGFTANYVALFAVAFAGLSAVAGVIAAIAALRSAGAARALADTAAEAEKRRLFLSLARSGQEIISKGKSIARLCDEIKLEYDSLAVFSEGTGGSRHKLFKDRAEGYRTEVAKAVETVETVTSLNQPPEGMTEQELGGLLVTYTMTREELAEIMSVLSSEKTDLQAQQRIYQEKAINQ